MQFSFVLLLFLLFSDEISGEQKSPRGENCLRGHPAVSPQPVEENRYISSDTKTTFSQGDATKTKSKQFSEFGSRTDFLTGFLLDRKF